MLQKNAKLLISLLFGGQIIACAQATRASQTFADAVRIRFEQLGAYPGNISLLDINANELGPLLYDKNLKKTVQILITPKGLECAECKQSICRHIKFAITNPKTQKLIRERKKEGWKLPDI